MKSEEIKVFKSDGLEKVAITNEKNHSYVTFAVCNLCTCMKAATNLDRCRHLLALNIGEVLNILHFIPVPKMELKALIMQAMST